MNKHLFLFIGKYIICVLSLLCLMSCEVSTTIEPNKSDIVGVWKPDSSTLLDMKDRGSYDISQLPVISVLQNGTLELKNMPDWWNNALGESRKQLNFYTGKWELKKLGDHWKLIILYDRYTNTIFDIEGNAPSYHLTIWLGDPDQNHQMVFVRD